MTMFIDARSVEPGVDIATDVCVIGSGAAGITVASELIGSGINVCLLESGGFEFDREVQDLYLGESRGMTIVLDAERQRSFGGATNLWGGYCRPLDEEDFEKRDWVPGSGWPFGRAELDPYYERAHKRCRLGPFNYDIESWSAANRCAASIRSEGVATKFFQLVPTKPVDYRRFGEVYRDEIGQARNISTYLHANIINLQLSDDQKTISHVDVATLSQNRFTVSARLFVLATGGIENARNLLMSNSVRAAGLGNEHDLVGRYFMAHLEVEAAFLMPAPTVPMDLYGDSCALSAKGWSGATVPLITLTPHIRRAERLLNATAEISPVLDDEVPSGLADDLRRILLDERSAQTAGRQSAYLSVNASETSPNPDSRVTLALSRDRLDRNTVSVDWRLNSADLESLTRTYEILGQQFGAARLGRVLLDVAGKIEKGKYWSQHHHIGTTRMHDDPRQGVVDATCRVHSVTNLYIAGSSVFPTSGSGTPTLSIIALAVRLADHVKEMLK